MNEPTEFPELNVVLHDLTTSVQTILGDDFVESYLQGSFGVGDADKWSDVDFTIAVRDELTETQITALQANHLRIMDTSDSHWAQHLEGSYVPLEVLRRYRPDHKPLVYVDNGSREFERSKHDDTHVVRWVTREHGIVLAGPDPKGLIDEISAETLRAEIRDVMINWGAKILKPDHDINSLWYQPFICTSYARMLHTQEVGRVMSKKAGVAWAQTALDERWAGLLRRALAERENVWEKVWLPAKSAEIPETLAFVRYAISTLGVVHVG